jgi:hypothetical protein
MGASHFTGARNYVTLHTKGESLYSDMNLTGSLRGEGAFLDRNALIRKIRNIKMKYG